MEKQKSSREVTIVHSPYILFGEVIRIPLAPSVIYLYSHSIPSLGGLFRY